MTKAKPLLPVLLVLAITVAACLALNRWDNKYTHPGAQPISGVLFLSEEDMDETPVHYLTREWEYYPGTLLTPETLEAWDGYRRFVDIGGKGNLRQGEATYRLTLMLPDAERVYALELPEVYSSCRLYINGSLVLTMGAPGTNEEKIATLPVCFPAGGRVELLLAVSNHSGVYGGLTYPPAFGEASAVLASRETRLLCHGATVLVALLGAVLALLFGLRGGRRRGVLNCLICLCLIGVTGYPLLHGLWATGFQPWYTVEAGCYYALLLLAVLIQCDLYGVWGVRAALMASPCAVGLVCAAVYFGGTVLPMFSLLSAALKYYAAACLLGLSGWALWRGKKHSCTLLCASAALAVSLIFDRLLPLYEPIYGGWFSELGGIVLAAALAGELWGEAVTAYRFQLSYREEERQLQQRLNMQKEHYRQLSGQIEKSREATHDLRHHVRVLRTMAESGETVGLLAYLDEYEPHLREREVTTYSDHLVADAILRYYAAEAARLEAVCDMRFAVPPDFSFPDDELCILLGNLLENAVEAMARQEGHGRSLYLRGGVKDGRLRLVVDNSFDGVVKTQDEQYFSAKREGHGLGLASVRTIAEKYGGLVDFSVEGTLFRVSLMIPVPKAAPAVAL